MSVVWPELGSPIRYFSFLVVWPIHCQWLWRRWLGSRCALVIKMSRLILPFGRPSYLA